jgi:CheY-like chemotaxis protein
MSQNSVVEKHAEITAEAVGTVLAGRFTILLVEDEEMLREFVKGALGSFGYQVLAAADGREALDIWTKHRHEIHLLLTDVVMPGLPSGRQLARQLRTEQPDLKIIFTSGYSAELLGPDFEQEREHGFLAKPYLTDSLARTVAAQLCALRM